MAKGKSAPPERSKLARDRPLAYSRRQKGPEGKDDGKDEGKDTGEAEAKDAAKAEAKPGAKPDAGAKTTPDDAAAKTTPDDAAPTAAPEAKTSEMAVAAPAPGEPPAIEPPAPKAEPWPDATPQPMRPVEPPPRARAETVAMVPEAIGAPPPLPATPDTFMPGPRDIPGGNVSDAAPPPGRVPPGDSRSLRKGNEFALIYRQGSAVITRWGTLGQRGQWRVVEYPTPASASNSYAKEVSRFVGDGFTDYRE